ncbi:SDR family NAD(P)-dependent oxidoreductase [Thalassobium sp. R2A62]|uniref:SDR family NAD(P)-dependent oxidoreductase n=1 Tax=Thalassobium sp. R2A62 TaxID=633131 RepID=UPI0001B1CC77|nr:SDR family NAD(P)-dependent oxidoreductase [Thalassobium sp. R2A62]EET47446.1 oxidoreductase, short-chain dehydrogenase/reductase family [Thalassobium sp. R2A62]
MHVLITGGSRGIGAAMTDRYRAAGHQVTSLSSRDMDVTDPNEIARVATTVGTVDLLVCNAGVYLDKGVDFEEMTAAHWATTLAVNVTGVAMTASGFLPALRRSESPKIAVVSSQMASQERAPGGSYAYRASKAAALNIGRNLATDLRPEGIAVGIYHPGWVQTDMGGDAADITVDQSAHGLVERFKALDMSRTGEFLTWDGHVHPY